MKSALMFGAISLASAGRVWAQHEVDPTAVQGGATFYRMNCSGCHGPDGNRVPGVDLGHNKFKRASTDQELIQIIRTGIAGTAMPPGNFTNEEAASIVAYLRSLAADAAKSTAPAGDAARGKLIFEGKGACTTCHRARGVGSRVAPDLGDIGLLRRSLEIEKSILDPDAEVTEDHRSVRAVMKDGTIVTGRLLNWDTFTVELIDSKEQLRALPRASLKEFTILKNSTMPSYQGKLSSQELSDVVAYLASLVGPGNTSAQ
jgi:putative heme-binding domain-containing protein